MPRPARYSDDDVLDAAAVVVAEQGHDSTLAMVALALGGPTGSIYHRFASRDELLARLWLREVHRFQAGLFDLVAGADLSDPESVHAMLVEMALHVPRYCRRQAQGARVMTLYRQDRLLRDGPAAVRDEVATLNEPLETMTRQLTRARYGGTSRRRLELVVAATRVCPYGLVRPYLGRTVPPHVDETVAAAADAILRLG